MHENVIHPLQSENHSIQRISNILARGTQPMSIQRLQHEAKIPYLNLISLLNKMHHRKLINYYDPKKNRSIAHLKKKLSSMEFCPECYRVIYKDNEEQTIFTCKECNIEFEVI